MRFKNLLSTVMLTVFAFTVSACAERIETHGSIIKPEQFDRIQVGIHKRNDVASLLGSPSTIGTFNDSRWYYYTEKAHLKSLGRKEVVERDIVMIDFSAEGTVSALSFRTKADGNDITPSTKTTRTHGQNMGIIDQFIDNFSRGL